MDFKNLIDLNRQLLTIAAKVDANIICQCSLTDFCKIATGIVYTQVASDGTTGWFAACKIADTHGGFCAGKELFRSEIYYWYNHRIFHTVVENYESKISIHCYCEFDETKNILEHSKGYNEKNNLARLEQLSEFLPKLRCLSLIA